MSTEDPGVEVGDVVQADPEHSRWGAVFVVVTEIQPWGVQGYFTAHHPQTGEPGSAHVRIEHGKYERIGKAAWIAT